MRIARIHHGGRPVHAAVEGDRLALLDDLAGTRRSAGPRFRGTTLPLAGARLLAPADPRVVLGMAHNTGAADRLLPPQAFLKPSRTVIGPGEPIPVPDGIGHVDAEGELAVVIGTTARHLTAAEALDAVLGYTVANDVTARDLQQSDPLWTTAKGQDGFTRSAHGSRPTSTRSTRTSSSATTAVPCAAPRPAISHGTSSRSSCTCPRSSRSAPAM